MTQMDQDQKRKNMVQTLLIVVIGQVGCLTLAVILASVFGGLWLDNVFGTKPMFTLVLLFAGIPLSVFLMLSISAQSAGTAEGKIRDRREKYFCLGGGLGDPKTYSLAALGSAGAIDRRLYFGRHFCPPFA
jgi:F0F1-type ATP synthase assembly protein I